ncbi:MAG TPA: FAD-dependent oxidoreductase [Steroidobacteraceae bacterium]
MRAIFVGNKNLIFARVTRVIRSVTLFWASLVGGIAWPYIELVMRLWIAKLFFGFGVLQLMHWELALELARQENPIPFLAPTLAAYVSTAIYLISGALLAVGLLSRYAAVPVLILAFITQLRYTPFDTQLFWIALAGWYVINGAGPLSLDNLLRRGLSDSAIPLVPKMIAFSKRLRVFGTPFYISLLRIWLGAALVIAAYESSQVADLPSLERWLPLDVAMRFAPAAAWLGGLLLIGGLATRYVAALLLVGLFGYSIVDPRLTDSIYLLMLLAIFGVYGGGFVSIDEALTNFRERFFPETKTPAHGELQGVPRVLIIGAGFGGLRCAQALRDAPVAVTLVDRTNYHLFQPLLYQVATAALSPGDIATPARAIFRSSPATRLLLGVVTGVDVQRQTVSMQGKEMPYDYLVLATGATHSYFGKDEWAPFAPGLKRIEDALEIRRRILTAFERAEAAPGERERQGLLTFLVVGAAPRAWSLRGRSRNWHVSDSKRISGRSIPRRLV